MQLMRYRYTIFHTVNKQMFLTDLLSMSVSPKDSVKIGRAEWHAAAVLLAEVDALLEEVRNDAASDGNTGRCFN